MAVPCLAMTFDDRAIHQVRQLREDYGFNTQHTWPRRNQLAIPQYNNQMAVDTLHTPPLGNHGESTWKASCDLKPQLSKIMAYLRSCVLQRPRLSCKADSGISSIEKANTIGLVSTSPQTSSSAIAPIRGASELSSSARARPYVHQSRPSKRLQGNDDDSDRDDEEPKASTSKRARSKSTQHQFACPFWKLDPHKQRSCYSATLSEIRYVKQHILRRHVQPTHCTICMETFDSLKDLDRHLMQRSCATSSDPVYEGINEDQRHELQYWSARRGSSKIDQWFELWDMIFPGIPRPNSPFIDEEVFGKFHPEYIPEQLNALTVHGAPEMSLNPWNANSGLPSLGTDGHKIANKRLKFACPYKKMFPQMISSSRRRICFAGEWETVHHLKLTDEVDKWREMYMILFPDAEEIPNPCLGQSESCENGKAYVLERYAEYLDRELPRRLRSGLNDSEPGLLDDRTMSQIMDIVRGAQRSLFQQYTSSNWFEVNGEWKKIECTSVEGSKFSDLTSDARTEPDEADTSTTGAFESIISYPPPSTGSGYKAPFEHISSTSSFLAPTWASLLYRDEALMGGSKTANNVSSELQTSSRDLEISSLIPQGIYYDGPDLEVPWSPTPSFLDFEYILNPAEEAGQTGIELESYRGVTSNSAESHKLEATDALAATEQQSSGRQAGRRQ
ncbi:hypothetical protein CNYM01_02951 [Colletotrichum nymphaeae SA-01]|uniref:C2H2-type domain-containing protein n=1 Tax=Colletotrichum nymphaeae SA-01 TaxID=1460502 RepID=A0A135S3Q2_9PEZI|nr:hypothetical protein CNYM01_02951 [Colletotrichum nymphaeae SA-01]